MAKCCRHFAVFCASSYYQLQSVFVEEFLLFQSSSFSKFSAKLSLLFTVFYVLYMLVSLFIPRYCIVKVKEIINGYLHKYLEEPLPHHLQQSNECSPLIK